MSEPQPAKLEVTSDQFADGGRLPMSAVHSGMGAGGLNRSPHLRWRGAPKGTKSFAVILHDPDAPTGVGFFHWTMWNIPAAVTELAENAGDPKAGAIPRGAVLGHTDFGEPGFGGAAPPPGHGDHRYQFTVYALDVPTLDIGANSTAALLRFVMRGHVLAQGTITGVFGR
jgi:Raf kinase inhibitor-like YbhB/YbcL family protein